jgi:hypothetical protein
MARGWRPINVMLVRPSDHAVMDGPVLPALAALKALRFLLSTRTDREQDHEENEVIHEGGKESHASHNKKEVSDAVFRRSAFTGCRCGCPNCTCTGTRRSECGRRRHNARDRLGSHRIYFRRHCIVRISHGHYQSVVEYGNPQFEDRREQQRFDCDGCGTRDGSSNSSAGRYRDEAERQGYAARVGCAVTNL